MPEGGEGYIYDVYRECGGEKRLFSRKSGGIA